MDVYILDSDRLQHVGKTANKTCIILKSEDGDYCIDWKRKGRFLHAQIHDYNLYVGCGIADIFLNSKLVYKEDATDYNKAKQNLIHKVLEFATGE